MPIKKKNGANTSLCAKKSISMGLVNQITAG
jgi:hypothetical protein